ncbi:MAG: hypothetical protein ACJ79S_09250 [Gemmatimonadaceae bacterium]
MRKAIQLRVTLWVEGDEEPAADFAKRATGAVRDIIAAGRKAHPELSVRVKRVAEDEGDDD